MILVNEEKLSSLRKKVGEGMSEKRYLHTLAVEDMAAKMAKYLCPEKEGILRAAGLVHDITKELSFEEQLRILNSDSFILSKSDIESPEVLHAYTAKIIIKEKYPSFSSSEILSAVEKHTLADAVMSVFDKIIFLADYIEFGRKYNSSLLLRSFVLDNMQLGEIERNLEVLDAALYTSSIIGRYLSARANWESVAILVSPYLCYFERNANKD